VVVQADALTETALKSVILCLMTSAELRAPLFRIPIEPTPTNGLDKPSQIMVEKLFTVPSEKVTSVIGRLSDEQLIQLNRILAFVVGLG
jgi:mRNA interferase MazF